MAIKFKVIERGQPGILGGGEKKFYASAQTNGDMTLAGLTRAIERSSTVGGEENLEDVKSSSIRKAKVIFTPGGAIRDMLDNLDYTKV